LPSRLELVLQLALALFLAPLVYDYMSAVGAACGEAPRSDWCSLWGGGDNPAGDFWNYRSRETYLRASLAQNTLFALAILAPIFLPGWRSGLTALLGIVIFGEIALHTLGPLLL
jgi:hypothetical protein